jgi:hypothetical protein
MLGAVNVGGLQMIINTKAAQVLGNKYFKIKGDRIAFSERENRDSFC